MCCRTGTMMFLGALKWQEVEWCDLANTFGAISFIDRYDVECIQCHIHRAGERWQALVALHELAARANALVDIVSSAAPTGG